MQAQYSEDPINQLPSDGSIPTLQEQKIVNALFTKHKPIIDSVFTEAKDSILAGVLFILLSLPQTDSLLHKFVPSAATSPYITLGIKALILMALFWLIKHFYLSRKTN